jgi:CheY-like chemotaxis protein
MAADGSHTDEPSTKPAANFGAAPEARRILLAEDNDDARKGVGFMLNHMGFTVVTASDGQEACALALEALAEGRPFDWILMDMEMPVVDGFEATRRLRSVGYTRPIIAMTAHAFGEAHDECLRYGCDDHVTKPIDWRRLTEILDAHL